MSQMNPKEVFHNTAYSVQLLYIAGHSFLSPGHDQVVTIKSRNYFDYEDLVLHGFLLIYQGL